jgi:hypothetical protein
MSLAFIDLDPGLVCGIKKNSKCCDIDNFLVETVSG